jgi:hypothetical protein
MKEKIHLNLCVFHVYFPTQHKKQQKAEGSRGETKICSIIQKSLAISALEAMKFYRYPLLALPSSHHQTNILAGFFLP